MDEEIKKYDIVYILKECAQNEELRYSLRSVCENFPVRNVWIFGYCPLWLKDTIQVRIPQTGNKLENSKMLFSKIAHCESLPDEFILFNDDFFVIEKVDEFHQYYNGLLKDRIEGLEKAFGTTHPLYAANLRKVLDRLTECGINPKAAKNFAVHKPMLFNRLQMIESTDLTDDLPMALRSFYGNYFGIKGINEPDTKVFTTGPYEKIGPYLSSDDRSFRLGKIGRDIRAMFPNKCKFEI